ncbi:MAG: RES domain-containing protein, partial [Acidobacteriota bacterium]
MKELPAIPPAHPLPEPVTVWRICSRRHAESAFSGEGARRFGGRWNFPGAAMVYASDSLSLAALEMLVHADWQDLPEELVAVRAEAPPQLAAIRLGVQD